MELRPDYVLHISPSHSRIIKVNYYGFLCIRLIYALFLTHSDRRKIKLIKVRTKRDDVDNDGCGAKRGFLSRVAALGIIALLIAMGLLSGCGAKSGVGVICAGSTSVQPFTEALSEDYMRNNPGTTVDVQGGGSAAGIMAAQTGTADIGMSSRDLSGDELSLWHVQIATDGLVIIVNKDNPITGLTMDQVRDIYTNTITNWSQLGGIDHQIHIITREEGSGTRSAFESLVMGESQITPHAMVQDSNGAVRQLVGSDSAAIGFISLGLVDQTVKALELDGVVPSRENIMSGTYKLCRPFLFVANDEPTGATKDFIDFVLSADGKKILAAEGLVVDDEGK
jgi:phosphate transport system substrate-binding protein